MIVAYGVMIMLSDIIMVIIVFIAHNHLYLAV